MKNPVRAYFFAPIEAQHLGAIRLLVGGYAVLYMAVRFIYLQSFAAFDPASFRPVGVVTLLSSPLPGWLVRALVILTALVAIAFAAGWRFRVVGPLFAALLLWVVSYSNSWGMIFHTENLLVLHVIVLGLSRAADSWSLDSRRRSQPSGASGSYNWPVKLLCIITVVAYFIAGVAKIRYGGIGWLDGAVLRHHIAIDNVRKIVLGAMYSPFAGPLMRIDGAYTVMSIMTLVVELGAPLALLHRRIAYPWVVGIMGFHWSVLALMMITFFYPLTGIAFVSFLPVHSWLARLRTRFRTASSRG
jgi:hypothetical protein